MPTKLDELREKHTRFMSEIKQDGRDAFVDFFTEYFLSIPGLEAIKWRQYTPYFNDGDTCEFGVHELEVKFNNDSTGGDYRDGYHECYSIRESIHEHNHFEYIPWKSGSDYKNFGLFLDKARFSKLQEMKNGFAHIPEDLFLISFGDHVSIIGKMKEDRLVLTVKDYEHS